MRNILILSVIFYISTLSGYSINDTLYFQIGDSLIKRNFDESFKLVYQKHFKNDTINGCQEIKYDKKNNIKTIVISNNNSEIIKITNRYYRNGRIKSVTRKVNRKRNGLQLLYCSCGSLRERSYYKNSKIDSIKTTYYCNGNTQIEGLFRKGKPIGVLKAY